jgi:selenocysteine lyase/cysteine desulfurase
MSIIGPVHPSYNISALRARIPIIGRMIPMSNCSQAPQTDATRAAAERYLDSWNRDGMDWDTWMHEVSLARAAFARLINAEPSEIAIFSSVSEATSAFASAIQFPLEKRGVVLSEAEFPTVGHVWLAQEARGAELAWARVTDGALTSVAYDELITAETAVVSACHAYYVNGALHDLDAIAARAHAHGALFFVDAYQAAGAIPIDVKQLDVDVLVTGNLKYLMGIPGIAFMYVRESRVESLHPSVTGWFGRENPYAFSVNTLDWAPSASRFDTGTPPILNAYVARAGMEMIMDIGVDRIRAWHEVLAHRLIDGGRTRGLELHGRDDVARKTANTAFVVGDSHAVEVALKARGIIAAARGPVIRLAPHFYNTIEDIDTTLDALADAVRA